MSYHINPDLLKAAQEMSGGLLNIPPDAKLGRGDQKRWTERLIVEGSTLEPSDEGNGATVSVRFRVSPAGVGSVNLNRTTSAFFRFDFDAKEGSGRYIMTTIAMSRVMALLKACGVEIDTTMGFDLGEFFGEAATSPLVSHEVNGLFVNKPDRDDPNTRRQEITNFTPVSD